MIYADLAAMAGRPAVAHAATADLRLRLDHL